MFIQSSDEIPSPVSNDTTIVATTVEASEEMTEDQKYSNELIYLRSLVKIPYLDPLPHSM